jgi:sugar lactone lactonase YvrE
LLSLLAAPSAHAVPRCEPDRPPTRELLIGQGSLESIILDQRGRLFYTDSTARALMRLDAPGEQPVPVLRDVPDALGGLAVLPDGDILMGVGNSLANGATGNVAPRARLLRVNPDSGESSVYASGLQMANGVELAADGIVYASNDVGLGIDRVGPEGQVQLRWAIGFSPNGLAIDSTNRYLFAAQTFQPAAVLRVEIANPARVETYAAATGTDIFGGPDGMAIDGDDRLLVTVNLFGELWRVGTDRSICSLASGIPNASDVAMGVNGSPFAADSAFAVGFGGKLIEVPRAGTPLPTPLPPTPPPRPDPPPPPAAGDAVRFAPRTARVRGGIVRFIPRVRVNGRRRVVRVRIQNGPVVVRARSGRPATVPVGRRSRLLRVSFRAGGHAQVRFVRLSR